MYSRCPANTNATPLKTAWGTTSLKTSSCVCFLVKQDVVELLEKRVKSRFSHRQINLFCDYSFEDYVEAFKSFLSLPAGFSDREYRQKWERQIEVWNHNLCLMQYTHLCFVYWSHGAWLSPFPVAPSVCLSPSLYQCLSPSLCLCVDLLFTYAGAVTECKG